ncbi:Uncharacterised protein [Chlamydia trachomatis]|nr:Uncharacterised protein [Chlamydia trachomatis]
MLNYDLGKSPYRISINGLYVPTFELLELLIVSRVIKGSVDSHRGADYWAYLLAFSLEIKKEGALPNLHWDKAP